MKISKFILALLITSTFICFQGFAQEEDKKESERSVESEYMSSVEDVIISELATSNERDSKLVALQYLEDAVEDGNVTPSMIESLESLAGEGITTVSKTNGRMMNNFPDIRAKACEILGKANTEEAAKTLAQIIRYDNEPMVLSAAIRSLGEIGFNEDDVVTDTIVFVSNRIQVMNPTSSMALEVIIALEKLAPDAKSRKGIIDCASRIAADYNFVTPVRTRALEFLKSLKSSGK